MWRLSPSLFVEALSLSLVTSFRPNDGIFPLVVFHDLTIPCDIEGVSSARTPGFFDPCLDGLFWRDLFLMEGPHLVLLTEKFYLIPSIRFYCSPFLLSKRSPAAKLSRSPIRFFFSGRRAWHGFQGPLSFSLKESSIPFFKFGDLYRLPRRETPLACNWSPFL